MLFDDETFDRLVGQAVASLPEQFRARMQNITIDIQALPDRATCRRMDLDSPYDLLGLYDGVPLTDRSVDAPYQMPDRITIYKRSIEAAAASGQEAVELIRTTVLHEIGHFFGLDEDDLEELGYR